MKEYAIKSFNAKDSGFGTMYNTVRNHFRMQYKGVITVQTENGVSVEEIVKVNIGVTDSATTALVSIFPLHWDEKFYATGRGKAAGYGYHRASAAVESAFCSAGVVFNVSIGGRGNGAIVDAVRLVTDYVAQRTLKDGEKILAVSVLECEV